MEKEEKIEKIDPHDPLRQEWFRTLCRAGSRYSDEEKFEQFVDMMFNIMLGKREEALNQPAFRGADGEACKAAFVTAMQQLGNLMERRRFEDILGDVHQLIRSRRGQKNNGSFYTPTNVSDLMAAVTDDPKTKERLDRGDIVTAADEALGAGRTLMSFAKLHADRLPQLRFYGTDIELFAVKMSFINFTLNGMAAQIIHGNSLTNEVWTVYHTMEWFAPPYVEAAKMARTLSLLKKLLSPSAGELFGADKTEEPSEVAHAEAAPPLTKTLHGQLLLDFDFSAKNHA